MRPQTFQHPEIRDENDNIIQPGAFGKNTPFCTKGNDGIFDYIANDLEYLYENRGSGGSGAGPRGPRVTQDQRETQVLKVPTGRTDKTGRRQR